MNELLIKINNTEGLIDEAIFDLEDAFPVAKRKEYSKLVYELMIKHNEMNKIFKRLREKIKAEVEITE